MNLPTLCTNLRGYSITRLLWYSIPVLLIGCGKHDEKVIVADTSTQPNRITTSVLNGQTATSISPGQDSVKTAIDSFAKRMGLMDSSTKSAHIDKPEIDDRDVDADLPFPPIARSETSIRDVEVFVRSVERSDSATLLRCVMQNRWGAKSRLQPKPIAFTLSSDQLAKAKLFDDQTAKVYYNELGKRGDVSTGGPTQLGASESKDLILRFAPLLLSTRSVTLIIPKFVTLPEIPVAR